MDKMEEISTKKNEIEGRGLASEPNTSGGQHTFGVLSITDDTVFLIFHTVKTTKDYFIFNSNKYL
jgi:hypothetical protein